MVCIALIVYLQDAQNDYITVLSVNIIEGNIFSVGVLLNSTTVSHIT